MTARRGAPSRSAFALRNSTNTIIFYVITMMRDAIQYRRALSLRL